MGIAIFIVFVLGCICLGCSITENNKQKKIFILYTVLFMITLFLLGTKSTIEKNRIVPAIEVYRGNTTLQITYQDSIPIDSVVVYKNK